MGIYQQPFFGPPCKDFMRPRMNKDMLLASCEVEQLFDWRKWAKEIPAIQFPRSWNVQIIPPLCGAVVRFYAHDGDESISVYLDCYNLLGAYGSPYWEAYPIKNDVSRFDMSDTEGLITAMKAEFRRQKRRKKK